MDEKEKHIEDLKEFYKKKNKDSRSDEKTEKKPKRKIFIFLKYIAATIVFALTIYFVIFLADNYYVPGLVHTRSKVRIPDVSGEIVESAIDKLEESGLRAEIIKERYDPRAAKNSVLRQSPEAGRVVKENRTVYITVSKGAEKIIVPELVGISSREARIKLLNSGLNVGEISYKFSDYYPADTVISQSLEKGKEIKFGEKVDLLISKGSENQLIVPDLKFKDIEEAEEILLSHGLRLGTIIQVPHEMYINGTVLSQFPPAGEEIIKNDYVDLEIVNNPE